MSTWWNSAACRHHDPRLWWADPPVRRHGAEHHRYQATVDRALNICRQCPVSLACLQDALDRDEPDGIWGGKLPDQRRRLLRRRVG